MFFRKSAATSDQEFEIVLAGCLKGDPQAQRTLYRQFYSYAKGVCLRYAASREEAEEILALVQQLPPAQRTVFSLHVVDGYSLREIADLLECNESTTRPHFIRARRKLQDLMEAVSAPRTTVSG